MYFKISLRWGFTIICLEFYDDYESRLLGKMTKSPFTRHSERVFELLDIIHNDVYGPLTMQATNGFSYFITFTNDFNRYVYMYLMNHKSEYFEKIKEFKNKVENRLEIV